VPAYLEAALNAKHLYESHGFEQVGTWKMDCAAFDVPFKTLELARMKAIP
jgi:hypothetical protein